MDGVAKCEEYVHRAAELDMKAISITDHGGLSGHRPFYRACKELGIKPILGIEAYFTLDRHDKRAAKVRNEPLDKLYNHLIIQAKNPNGLKNLMRLNEIAWTEGFYTKPRMDFEILDQYGDDLIISSACMGGLINQAIEQGEFATAKQHLQWFKDRFGDDFYVELMPHNIPGMNTSLYALANSMGIKSIVTPDCHHATEDQREMQELMLILNTHPAKDKTQSYETTKHEKDFMKRLDMLYPDRKMTFSKLDIHLLSYDEIKAGMDASGEFGDDIYKNTLEIAEKVESYKLKSRLNLLPLKTDTPADELKKLVYAGMKRRGIFDDPEHVVRIQEELTIINQKEFAPYFLIVSDLISWAKSQGIRIGPGRGSAAGSDVCYALGITDIDPIEHGLLFFRFIDVTRSDFPDIDIDIQDSRREEVKAYLEKKYKNVASIATFRTFGGEKEGEQAGKDIVKDVSRVLSIPLADVNKVSKQIDSWNTYVKSSGAQWFREKYPEVETYGTQLLGRIRGTGIHAAGIITSKVPVSRYAPMEARDKEINGVKQRIPVVALDMEEVADIGFIKIDLLGLKALTVIDDTLKSIKERHKIDINLLEIPMNDSEIYKSLSLGNTKGVFQCEEGASTRLIMKMGVRNFDELVASNALVRPGAMNTIGKEYIDRKHGKAPIKYHHDMLRDDLADTYGTILYQEQVMITCVKLGGMTMEDANKVRKIIGKKKDAREFDVFKDEFVQGAAKHVGTDVAEHIWHSFEAHADYSFNKSHAVAYSTISYWTAWLKFYYPLDFMFALLKSEQEPIKRTEYLIEAKRLGIPIRLPHVNDSDIDFKIEGKAIRFGLSSVKYVATNGASKIIAGQPYKSAEDFSLYAPEHGINKRAVSCLDSIGAITFPDNPRNDAKVKSNLYEILSLPEFNTNLPSHFYSYLSEAADFEETGAAVYMGIATDIKRGKGWSRVNFMDKTGTFGVFDIQDTKVEKGKVYLVLVASNRIVKHIPLDNADKADPLIRFFNYKTLPFGPDEVYVIAFQSRVTKAGKKMATMVVADYDRNLHSVLVFPSIFPTAYIRCEPGTAVKILTNELEDGTMALQNIQKGTVL